MLRRKPTRLTLTDADQEEFQQLSENHKAAVRAMFVSELAARWD